GSIRADINKSVFMDPSFVLGIISLLTERESGVRQTPEGRFIAEYWRDTRKMADINLLNWLRRQLKEGEYPVGCGLICRNIARNCLISSAEVSNSPELVG